MVTTNEIYSTEHEAVLLGTILFTPIENYKNSEGNPFTFLDEDDFFYDSYRRVYKVAKKLYEKDIQPDEILIRDELIKDFPGIDYADILLELMSVNVTANLIPYIQEIKKKKIYRTLTTLSASIREKIGGFAEPSEIINDIVNNAEKLREGGIINTPIINAKVLLEAKKDVRTRYQTGTYIDVVLDGGFDAGSISIFIGEPESGKTHIVYSFIESSSNFYPAGIISLEFGEEDYQNRLSGFNNTNLCIKSENICLNFTAFMISDVISTLYSYARMGVKLAAIDSLHFIAHNTISNPTEALDDIVKKIDIVAKRTGMHIMIIALGSKDDYSEKRNGIRGSSLIPHLPKIFLRIDVNKDYTRTLQWIKNKQTRRYPKTILKFCDNGEITLLQKGSDDKKRVIIDINDM